MSADEPGDDALFLAERRVGRPRSVEADEAILQATIAEFADCGYEGLRVEAVAERAGVAKSTIYRRYPGKSDLVHAALLCAQSEEPVAPQTASLADDMFVMAVTLRDKFASHEVGRLIPTIVDAASRHPEFAAAHHEFIAERRRGGLGRLRRAIDAGELPPDTDEHLLMDMVSAPIFYRTYVSGAPLDDDTLRELIARALRAHGVAE